MKTVLIRLVNVAFVVITGLTSFAAHPQMQLGQSEDGVIGGWAVLGPFAWSGGDVSDALTAIQEAISKEGLAACQLGSTLSGRTWQYIQSGEMGRIDLLGSVGTDQNIEAFAMCILSPKEAVSAVFRCGSDDGLQVWIDGKEVHKNLVSRGWGAGADVFTADLPARPVVCLARITQGGGDWAFSMQVMDAQGRGLPVYPTAYLNPSAKAFLRPAWDKQTLSVTVSVAAFEPMDNALIILNTQDGQSRQQTVTLEKLGDLKTVRFSLPWMTEKVKPETASVRLIQDGRTLADEQVVLLPSYALSRAWIDGAGEKDDPWQLVRLTPYDAQLADAFVGNGYYGIRVASEGTGATYGNSRTQIGGIYKDGARVDHPRWYAVDLTVAGKPYRPAMTDEHYRQTLDMRHCRLTTRGRWHSEAGPVDVVIELIPHRTRPHLLMMQYTLTALDKPVELVVKDTLDASVVRHRSAVQSDTDPLAVLSYRIESIGLTEAVAAFWKTPNDTALTYSPSSDGIEQHLTLTLLPNKPVILTRYAALHTRFNTPDPVAACRTELERAAKDGFAELAKEHDAAWRQLWQSDILVPNRRTQQLIHSALFQSYCNLRDDYPWSTGPVGLSGTSWEGRVFWDADLWVFPPLALLQPSVARSIVEYRCNTLGGAIEDAKKEGRGGAKFAWESADDGTERCPWPPAIEQRHIQNDVALAQWQYYLCTGDEAYLRDKALPVITAAADYWVDRVDYNAEHDRYEIRHVLGPDEFAENINNNTFTNYGAILTLRRAAELNARFGKPIRPEWTAIADKLYLPFDEKNQRYMQHDAYNGEQIKQADTSLSIYPLEMPMSDTVKRNILEFYPSNRHPSPIMMSSAIYAIAFSEINDRTRAADYVSELTGYFWLPFLLTSESPNRGNAAADHMIMSFITGQGGFLQTYLNGFAGIRIRDDGLLVQPGLPACLPWMEIKGVHYNGKRLNIRIDGDTVRITSDDTLDFRVYDRNGKAYTVGKP